MDAGAVERTRPWLLAWFDAHRRDLPWRAAAGEPADPYRVWVSEVMLQQTRVETVRPYFERWLERFPTVSALAAAEPDEVLKAWEGLGYYSRARNLHRAAREVEALHGGRVPDDPHRFRALPGVGRYTAGAVLSIAFGRREPVVDGNVRRVFARLLDEEWPADATLWELAGRFAECARPGDVNQALMELGAVVCTRRSPACATCPLADACRARRQGTQAERPRPRVRAERRVERHGVAVVRRESEVLLVRRPDRGLLGGLWELPGAARKPGESAADAAARAASGAGGIPIRPGERLGVVRHEFTHLTIEYEAFLAAAPSSPAVAETSPRRRTAWASPDRLDGFTLPAAQHRILELYRQRPRPSPDADAEADAPALPPSPSSP